VERAPGEVGLLWGWINEAGVAVEGRCHTGERYVVLDESGWLGVVLVDRAQVFPVTAPLLTCDAHWLEGVSYPPRVSIRAVGPTLERWPSIRMQEPPGGYAVVTPAWRTTATFDVDGDGVADVESRQRTCGARTDKGSASNLDSDQVETRVRDPLGTWRVTERHEHEAIALIGVVP
jgi:hypothetical protein